VLDMRAAMASVTCTALLCLSASTPVSSKDTAPRAERKSKTITKESLESHPGPARRKAGLPTAEEGVLHIRVEDRQLQQMLDRGIRDSETLQLLVTNLQSSDVIAYIRCDSQLGKRMVGNLSFVTSAAQYRFVLIRVGCVGARVHQIAVIGHELRHAIEVADTSSIVDVASFHREYSRIGFLSNFATSDHVMSYETDNAKQAGIRILHELRKAT